MRTEVHIVAERGRSPRVFARGGIAVRSTGPDVVHLVGAAATPLGGDSVRVRVEVLPGARLCVRSVAATLVLPAQAEPASRSCWSIDADDGAWVRCAPEPTVVAGIAEHHADVEIRAHGRASVEVSETVQIGRHGEREGRWSGRLTFDVDSAPRLRHRLDLDRHRRALISRLRFPDGRPSAVSPTATAARLVLAGGGTLTTVVADSLGDARRVEGQIPS